MRLRQNSERRAPLIYEGDGTYSNSRLTASPSSPPADESDEHAATAVAGSGARRRGHDSLTPVNKRRLPPSPASLQAPTPPTASQSASPISNVNRKARRGMANIKFIRPAGDRRSPARETQKRTRTRRDRTPADESIATASFEPATMRPTEQVDSSKLRSMKPAAFPSLQSGVPIQVKEVGSHGIMLLMKERHEGDMETRRASFRRIDRIYDAKRFPASMPVEQRQWYVELNKRMSSTAGVGKVTFRSLWPSLRQTIIDQIRDECPNAYKSDYEPVLALLRLQSDTLGSILQENAQAWETDDEIPQYLLDLKRRNPSQPIDPDTPPPQEVIKAIHYLKQEHLPASLLSEWQYPLPDFAVPTQPSARIDQGPVAPVESDAGGRIEALVASSSRPPSRPEWSPITPAQGKVSAQMEPSNQVKKAIEQSKEVRDTGEKSSDLSPASLMNGGPQSLHTYLAAHPEQASKPDLGDQVAWPKSEDSSSDSSGGSQRRPPGNTNGPVLGHFPPPKVRPATSGQARPTNIGTSRQNSNDGSAQAFLKQFRSQSASRIPLAGQSYTPTGGQPRNGNAESQTVQANGTRRLSSSSQTQSQKQPPIGAMSDVMRKHYRLLNNPRPHDLSQQQPRGESHSSNMGLRAKPFPMQGSKQAFMLQAASSQPQQILESKPTVAPSHHKYSQLSHDSHSRATPENENSIPARALTPQQRQEGLPSPQTPSHDNNAVQHPQGLAKAQPHNQQHTQRMLAGSPAQRTIQQVQHHSPEMLRSQQNHRPATQPFRTTPTPVSPRQEFTSMPTRGVHGTSLQSPRGTSTLLLDPRLVLVNSPPQRLPQAVPSQQSHPNTRPISTTPFAPSSKPHNSQAAHQIQDRQNLVSSALSRQAQPAKSVLSSAASPPSPPLFPNHLFSTQPYAQRVNDAAVQTPSPSPFHIGNLMRPMSTSASPDFSYGDPFASSSLSNINGPYFRNPDQYLDHSPYLPHQRPKSGSIYPGSSPPELPQQQMSPPQRGQHTYVGSMDPRLFINLQKQSQELANAASDRDDVPNTASGRVIVSSVRDVNRLMKPFELKRRFEQMIDEDGLDENGYTKRLKA